MNTDIVEQETATLSDVSDANGLKLTITQLYGTQYKWRCHFNDYTITVGEVSCNGYTTKQEPIFAVLAFVENISGKRIKVGLKDAGGSDLEKEIEVPTLRFDLPLAILLCSEADSELAS